MFTQKLSVIGKATPPLSIEEEVRVNFSDALDIWETEGAVDEHRLEASNAIELCWRAQSTKLALPDFGLSTLPLSLHGMLAQLESAYLSGNGFTTLPQEIAKFTSLTELNLANNQLTELPVLLIALDQLVSLDLAGNSLTGLPNLLSLPSSLKSLNLAHNGFSTLPTSMLHLSGLTELDLADNFLTALPPVFSQLNEMVHLNLSQNQFAILPIELQSLSNLQTLMFENNLLSILPVVLPSLPMSLTALFLGGNPMTYLPHNIKVTPDLITGFTHTLDLSEEVSVQGIYRSLSTDQLRIDDEVLDFAVNEPMKTMHIFLQRQLIGECNWRRYFENEYRIRSLKLYAHQDRLLEIGIHLFKLLKEYMGKKPCLYLSRDITSEQKTPPTDAVDKLYRQLRQKNLVCFIV